jgi:DNA-binding IclR family transcriptional regulator
VRDIRTGTSASGQRPIHQVVRLERAGPPVQPGVERVMLRHPALRRAESRVRPDAEREAIYARGLEPFTEQTLVTGEELEREAARVREPGYAYSQGQRSKGAIGLGALLVSVAADISADLRDSGFIRDARP